MIEDDISEQKEGGGNKEVIKSVIGEEEGIQEMVRTTNDKRTKEDNEITTMPSVVPQNNCDSLVCKNDVNYMGPS